MSASYRITDDLFAIPYSDKFILYSPLRRLGFLVNGTVVQLLRDIETGKKHQRELTPDELDVITVFEKARILNGTAQDPFADRNTPFLPTETTLFLTTKCNLYCSYCYAGAGETKRLTLSPRIAKAAVDYVVGNAVRAGGESIGVGFHGGGEPTLAWSVLKATVEHAHNRARQYNLKANISMATNGVMPTRKINWIIDNFTGLNLSFDGVEDVQNQQRPMVNGAPTFAAVLKTVERMDQSNFPYGIRATVTRLNVHSMGEFIEFLGTNTNARTVHFEPTFSCGRCVKTGVDAPTAQEFIEGYRAAEHSAARYGITVLYSGARSYTLTDRFCEAAGNSFCVTADGFVSSCYEVFSQEDPRSAVFFYGRYDEQSGGFSLAAERLATLQSRVVGNIDYCRDCFCKYHCAGDCLTRSTDGVRLNDINSDYRCELNRALTRDQIVRLVCGQ
ncbi:MAG: radical SAM protein [Gammaproteobacteria bacterium]